MSHKRHRWNSIGRTRRKLAEILTAAARARAEKVVAGSDETPIDVFVDPAKIYAMRLAGRARLHESAHSWEAFVTSRASGNTLWSYYSFSSMTDIVRAGAISLIGRDGECCPASPSESLAPRVVDHPTADDTATGPRGDVS